ncbi:hypothetical protein [Lysinibacillus sphaericus]|nr:hypothetical protein [Lysinibacillus sphaericus]
MSNTNQQKETETKMPKWKCDECGFEFYGISIVCPSCEFADVEKIEE